MNTIISRTDNVNFTTVKTAGEASHMISRFDALVNLSKFALASEPEREDAIQRIKHAMTAYPCSDKQKEVLSKVIDILML